MLLYGIVGLVTVVGYMMKVILLIMTAKIEDTKYWYYFSLSLVYKINGTKNNNMYHMAYI